MRRRYLDNIRWITVCLVVLYHVIYMFNGVETAGVAGPFHENQWQDAIQYLLYPWFMAVLFIVSGASARFSLEQRSEKAFLRDRTRRLLVPSTLGLLAFQWIQGMLNMRLGNAMQHMQGIPGPVLYLITALSGTGVLWTAQMMWLFSVLLLAVRKVEKGRLYGLGGKASLPVLLLLGIPVWLSAQVLNTPVILVYRFGLYGMCFFLGYFVFCHDEAADRLARAAWPLAAAAILLLSCFTVVYWGKLYAEAPVVNSPLAMACCWLGSLAVLACGRRWGECSTAFTRWMSARSFGLYVFHYLPISLCGLLLPGHLPPWLIYVLTGIAAFAGGWLINALVSRIPVLRWCVLGIKKGGKACVQS